MTTPIDLSPLLDDLNQQLASAELEARVLQMKIARLRGLRDGVLMVLERANTIITSGEAPANAEAPPDSRDKNLGVNGHATESVPEAAADRPPPPTPGDEPGDPDCTPAAAPDPAERSPAPEDPA